MTTTGRVSGAARPITLRRTLEDGSVEERSFQFSPLADVDYDEIDEWLQARSIENARRSLTPDMSQTERDETMRIAIQGSLELTFMSAQGVKRLASVAGMTRLLWQSVKKRHPDVTEDYLRKFMFDAANINEVNAAFSHVNAVPKVRPKNRHRAKKRKS